jgi:hypothetical protein
VKVEYAHERKIREKNKPWYRVAHWPLWIWVFGLAPGPLTFDLFAGNPSVLNVAWVVLVLICTGLAALRGQLPGVEPRPYILRFTEDRPNPLYRKVCYTFAWADAITFASLNLAGLLVAVVTGTWYLKQIYLYAYFPLYGLVLALGAAGILPRVRRSTQGEGTERRYFYGTVWSVTISQTVLMVLWKAIPRGHAGDIAKLAVYGVALAICGVGAMNGVFPRTRPIVPGELMVAD